MKKKEFTMKNIKIILLVLIGLLLIGSFGCGGGGSVYSKGNSELQDEQQEQQEQTDETVSRIINKMLAPSSDGSPAIFDYATPTEESDEYAAADTQEVQFVKYISSKDLNVSGDFVKTIRLNKNSEYVIKYSHAGRSLNNSSLNLRITAPNSRDMILDLTKKGAPEISETKIPGRTFTEDEIQQILDETGMTRAEFDAEISNDNKPDETIEPIYVNTDLEVIPEENPCVILYRFKAPLTGNYEFAISEVIPVSGDIIKNVSSDIPFEFRIYGSEESYSAADDEELEFTPREIVHLQRILLKSATKFNENGLPVFDYVESSDNNEVHSAFLVLNPNNPSIPDPNEAYQKELERKRREKEREEERKRAQQAQPVIPDAEISNVPYDPIFEEGAGFYAHSGLRGVTNVIDDESFSKNAVRDFTMPTPGNGNAASMKENFSVNVIATEEEHDRTMEIGDMSNFALLRDALGYTKRQDYARLGSDHTKIIQVRYELIENKPRIPDKSVLKMLDEALDILKEEGSANFTNEYGDYFVAGYTWGVRYDATIEITAKAQVYSYDSGFSNDGAVARHVQEFLERTVSNAISERDTGRSLNNNIKYHLDKIKEFQDITVRVIHSSCTGRSGDLTFSLEDFANSLVSYVKSAKKMQRSQYEKLYVTLRRYREIDDARPYINEVITTPGSRYYAIRDLTETIFKTRCYYNALMAIPASNLLDGTATQNKWKDEFETQLVTRMRGGLNYICADEGRINEYYNKFNALYEKYKALAERYNFYCFLLYLQKTFSSPSWDDSDDGKNKYWELGFNSMSLFTPPSDIVHSDMNAGRYKELKYEEPSYSGHRSADFSDSFSNERIYWFITGYKNTNGCTGRDMNGTTLGKKSYHWHYTGGKWRRLEVYFYFRTIRMTDEDYPFAGL